MLVSPKREPALVSRTALVVAREGQGPRPLFSFKKKNETFVIMRNSRVVTTQTARRFRNFEQPSRLSLYIYSKQRLQLNNISGISKVGPSL